MESVIVKSVDILLTQPPETLVDKDDYIVKSIVKGMDCFTKICKIATLHRHKNYSEAKQEELGRELSRVLFYTSLLVHLCDQPLDMFEVEDLTEFSTTFADEYQQDTILCSMNAIRNFIDIAEEQFVGEEYPEELPGEDDGGMEFTLEGGAAGRSEEGSEGEGEEGSEEEGSLIELALAEIYASVIILCERFELDLEAVMDNVSIIEKP